MTAVQSPPPPTADLEKLGLRPGATPAPEADADAPGSVGSWLRRRAASFAVLAPVLAVIGVVQVWGIGQFPARFDDEGTYVAQAWAVQHLGQLGHYTYWYDHPPLGWIVLALLGWPMHAFDGPGTAIAAGRALLVPITLLTAALVYAFARRLGIRRVFAALAVLAFGLSPLALNYHRMVWLDNLAMPWLIGAFVLALTPGKRLWAYAGAGACFAGAVLTKETMLLMLPALALAVWQSSASSTRRFCFAVFGATFLLLVSIYPLYALIKGELVPGPGHVSLLEGIKFQLSGRAPSGSIFKSGTLSNYYVNGWLTLDRLLLGAGLAASLPALLSRRLRVPALAFLIQVLMMLRPGYLPAPYVIAMLPFAALLAAAAFDAVAGWRPNWPSPRFGIAGPVIASLAVVAAVVVAVPRWAREDRRQMTSNADQPMQTAAHWLQRHAGRQSRLLIDDTLWVDLVRDGFPRRNVVWYYKLGTDGMVDAAYPRGWRQFDYVVSSQMMRTDRTADVRAALRSSHLVAGFGKGTSRVEIRRVRG
ncbi:MAG: ArnT family glycosyltransferase [Thermoleophilaceae bacterium]